MPNFKNRRFFDNGSHKGFAGGNICICPQCGAHYEHIKGKPCREMHCTTCKIPLMNANRFQEKRNESYSDVNKKNDSSKNKTSRAFPFVLIEKCISCGVCIDACPRKAIDFVDDAAFIYEEKCSNCNICIKVCPENAIILKD